MKGGIILFKDYYEILEVSRNASLEVIEKAYKALAMKYHPDSNNFNSDYANKMMREINEAYDVLRNINKRNEYNKIYDSMFRKINYSPSNSTASDNNAKENPKEEDTNKDIVEQNCNEKESFTSKFGPGLKIIIASVVIFAIGGLIIHYKTVLTKTQIENNYISGVKLANSGDYKSAIIDFEKAGDYNDSKEWLKKIGDQAYSVENYSVAYDAWNTITQKILSESGGNQRLINVFSQFDHLVSCGNGNSVGLRADGTVEAIGYNGYHQSNLSGWNNIKAVSAGCLHTAAIKKDGTVVAIGDNEYGQLKVTGWENIKEISVGYGTTVGLKNDGTVVAIGYNYDNQCKIGDWSNIVGISAGNTYIAGLKKDGTVVTAGGNYYGQRNVTDWDSIVAISSGDSFLVGLRNDGTVVAQGINQEGQCYVSDWNNVVSISTGYMHTVGLKSDGTVIATGNNKYGQCNVSSWKNIVAIDAGYYHTVGIMADGTVVSTNSALNLSKFDFK